MKLVKKRHLLLCISGLGAGLVNGLLGAGGGIILVAALAALRPRGERRDCLADALIVSLPVTVVSAIIYLIRALSAPSVASSLPSPLSFITFFGAAVIGGFCGALILGKINARLLGVIFSVIVVCSGLLMIVR